MTSDSRFLVMRAVIRAAMCAAVVAALPLYGQDSLNVGKIAEVNMWMDYAQGVHVEGNAMYVLSLERIHVYDISLPETPVVRGSAALSRPGWSTHSAMSSFGGYLYIGTPGRGIEVVDIHDLDRPESVRYLPYRYAGGQYETLVAYENALFIGARDTLFVIAVTDPVEPMPADTLLLPGGISFVSIDNGWLFVGNRGLKRFSLGDPLAPQLNDTLATPSMSTFTATNGRGYGLGNRFYSYDLSDRTMMLQLSSIDFDLYWNSRILSLDAGTVVIQSTYHNTVLDVSDPVHPQLISRFDYETDFSHGALAQHDVYIPDWDRGVRVFSLAEPAEPIELGPVGGKSPSDIVVDGDFAYVALDDSGVVIFDLTNLAVPVETARILMHYSGRLQKVGDYLYAHGEPFTVSYVADPYYPLVTGTGGREHGWINMAEQSDDLVAFSDMVLTNRWGELTLYEISDFGVPAVIESELPYSDYGPAISLAAQGHIAYIEFSDDRIAVMDFSDPAHPLELASIRNGIRSVDAGDSTSRHLTTDGDYLWYCGAGGWLWLYDLSDPGTPEQVWYSDTTHFSRVYVSGSHLFAIENWPHDFVYILNISNRASPTLSGYYSISARGLGVAGSMVIAATGSGLDVLNVSQALGTNDYSGVLLHDFKLYPAYPNPFNGVTTIRFELPRTLPVVYAVYNALGQSVERRDVGVLSGGAHSIAVNANDWSSGSYWVRLQAGAEVRGTKIVLVR